MHSFWLLTFVTALFGLDVCASILDELHIGVPSSALWKRGDFSALDLRSAETFMWGDGASSNGSQAILGNLTVYMPDETENILSMGRFQGMIQEVKCSNSTLDIKFVDDTTFAYAKATWDWVNGADNHSFVMVAEKGDCGYNQYRLPFVVSTLEYDEVLNVAHLKVNASSWKDVAHTFDLHVGGVASPLVKSKRFLDIDTNKDISIDFNHDLTIPAINIPDPNLQVSIACPSCGTKGSFEFSFDLHTELFIPKAATLSLKPNGVSATINPQVSISGTIASPVDLKYPFPDISIATISIPNILSLGPVLESSIGIAAGPVQGSTTISAGLTYSLPDTASLSINLLSLSDPVQHTDWTPVLTQTPLTLTGSISATVNIYAKAAIAMKADVLGLFGYEAQVKVQPYIKGSLQALASADGACAGDSTKSPVGVAIVSSYGVGVVAAVNDVNKESSPIVSATLFSVDQAFPSVCVPIGSGKPVVSGMGGGPTVVNAFGI